MRPCPRQRRSDSLSGAVRRLTPWHIAVPFRPTPLPPPRRSKSSRSEMPCGEGDVNLEEMGPRPHLLKAPSFPSPAHRLDEEGRAPQEPGECSEGRGTSPPSPQSTNFALPTFSGLGLGCERSTGRSGMFEGMGAEPHPFEREPLPLPRSITSGATSSRGRVRGGGCQERTQALWLALTARRPRCRVESPGGAFHETRRQHQHRILQTRQGR